MSLKLKFKVQAFLPFVFCIFGLFICFSHFWQGFDAISGDAGDARFNALVLEHSWLWLNGMHESLFNPPSFYPHLNTLAYSDYLFGVAPIYWCIRALGSEVLLSFQLWLVSCTILNFAAFYLLARRLFKIVIFFSSLAAYVFAFALPRIMFLEHAQLVPQFFIVVSALGLMKLVENPTRKIATLLFLGGIGLQFITAFYFIWFWMFSLSAIAVYFVVETKRRRKVIDFLKSVVLAQGWPFLAAVSVATFCMIAPFLYHYALAGRELGTRHWASISDTVPRVYSWLAMSDQHWEHSILPFKGWMERLPMPQEHFLSFGIGTWLAMSFALVFAFRDPKFRYLSIPLITVFAFTLTSGRFSTWIVLTYLFPGGRVIRAVGRIQVFMLLYWALVLGLYLQSLWSTGIPKKRAIAALIICVFFAENAFVPNKVFSRSQNNLRVASLIAKIPSDCAVIAYAKGFEPEAYVANLDATQAAYETNRSTVNGYSGNEPLAFDQCFVANPKKSLDDSIQCWLDVHPKLQAQSLCKIESI